MDERQLWRPINGLFNFQRGKEWKFLGMKLDFTTPWGVRFGMKDYIKKMVNNYPEKLVNSNTQAADHPFNIQEIIPKFNKK